MSDAATQTHLVRMSREWAFPGLALLFVGAVVVVSFIFLPGLAQMIERQTFERYSQSVAGVLRLLSQSEKLANTAQASLDPRTPDSRAGRAELTRARQTAAAALHDLRELHAPIGTEEAQARLQYALVNWSKSLDAIEGGYVAHSTQGWQKAFNDNYQFASGASLQLSLAEAVLVKRGRETGFTFQESAAAFGLAASRLAYEPSDTATILAAQPLDVTYKTGLQKALDSFLKARKQYQTARDEFALAAHDAASLGDAAGARIAVEDRAATAAARMEKATEQVQAAAIAFGTITEPAKTKDYAAGQKDLAKAAGLMAFTIMPGHLRVDRGLLAATLAADRGPAAEQRFARVVAQERRLTQLQKSVEPLLKRAQPMLPFLAFDNAR